MWKNINLGNCLSYINSLAASEAYIVNPTSEAKVHAGNVGAEGEINPTAKPSITISRMCGAGGRTVASKLVEYLQPHTPAGRAWTIFDKNLIEKVLEDHHLSRRLAEFLQEDRKSRFAEVIQKMRGLNPTPSTLVEQTAETVWSLAHGGYVILVGRAGNVITEKLPEVFHVRLVGSLERRIARIEEVYEMSRNDAHEYVKAQDAAKRLYMKEYFGRDIDDPLLYHLVVNTDNISYERAAQLIGDAVVSRFKLAAHAGIAAS
jgi:cytidylate kinase